MTVPPSPPSAKGARLPEGGDLLGDEPEIGEHLTGMRLSPGSGSAFSHPPIHSGASTSVGAPIRSSVAGTRAHEATICSLPGRFSAVFTVRRVERNRATGAAQCGQTYDLEFVYLVSYYVARE